MIILPVLFALAITGAPPPAGNVGNLWTGNGYVLTTIDTARPLKFQGGPITCDLKWDPAMDSSGGGFVSPLLDIGAGQPVVIQFCARLGFDGGTWGLCEFGVGPPILSTIGDYWVVFDAGSSGSPVNVRWTAVTPSATAPRAGEVLWALQRAGVKSFTITQP